MVKCYWGHWTQFYFASVKRIIGNVVVVIKVVAIGIGIGIGINIDHVDCVAAAG